MSGDKQKNNFLHMIVFVCDYVENTTHYSLWHGKLHFNRKVDQKNQVTW